jgi:hypothetical protein
MILDRERSSDKGTAFADRQPPQFADRQTPQDECELRSLLKNSIEEGFVTRARLRSGRNCREMIVGFSPCVRAGPSTPAARKSEGAAAFRLLNSAKEIAEALAAGLFVAKSEISHRSVAQGIVDHSIYATRSSAQTTRIQLGLEAAPTGAASGSGVAGALAPAGVAGFFASSLPTMRASARNK